MPIGIKNNRKMRTTFSTLERFQQIPNSHFANCSEQAVALGKTRGSSAEIDQTFPRRWKSEKLLVTFQKCPLVEEKIHIHRKYVAPVRICQLIHKWPKSLHCYGCILGCFINQIWLDPSSGNPSWLFFILRSSLINALSAISPQPEPATI